MFGFGMLDGMFGDMMDPFGMMGGNRQRRDQQLVQHQSPFGPMMPFGFPDIGGMMRQMEQAMHDPNAMTMNGPGFMSSSVVQMTYDGTGQPQIYQESATTRQAPGGARETRRTVTDTVSGTKKMSIGHHMGARARVVERKQDLNTREMEENEELINLSDDEKDEFEREWQQRANVGQSRAMAAREAIGHHGHRPGHRSEMLALPAPGHASRSSHPRSERRSRGPHGSTTHGRPRRDQRRLPHH